jgi:HD-like signal output (HDOD) protein
MNQKLLEQIDHIPSLPESVLAVEKVYATADSSVADLAKVIEKDPFLVTNLIKIANSPLYGFSRKVSSVQQISSLFGREAVRGFVMSIGANSCFDIDLSPYGISKEAYQKRAISMNAMVVNWACKIDKRMAELLAPASFLIDTGKIIISKYIKENHQTQNFKEALSKHQNSILAELEVVGSKGIDVTATLFNHWNFDPDLVHLIRFSDNPEDAHDDDTFNLAVHLKVITTLVGEDGEVTNDTIKEAYALAKEYEMNEKLLDDAVNKMLSSVA